MMKLRLGVACALAALVPMWPSTASAVGLVSQTKSAGACTSWIGILRQGDVYKSFNIAHEAPQLCASVAVANRFRDPDGKIYRTTYNRTSRIVNGQMSVVASTVPAGTTMVGGQAEICPATGSCKTFVF